ncbi:type II secretion system F family protein [Sulfitobacter albidus]|uniref:Type II secretion system F family protein n=1 Tax=Sulfitobacter albidus TaxID=2829501 RepID=A0A975JDW8_9RHOB|nr:type II secretion system F family protein [Sulfitobacter albidus]QUJ76702.1 type II secretion system F family protein [Sulfitobacter albidus]
MLAAQNKMAVTGLATPENLLLYCAAFAAMLLLFGLVGLFAMRDRTAGRVRAMSQSMNRPAQPGSAHPPSLTKGEERAPSGWKKALIPEDPSERMQIRFQLGKLGFERPDVVELFFLLRLFLSLITPISVFGAVALTRAGLLPEGLSETINDTAPLRLLQIAMVGTAVGFYGPGYWLKSRIKARQEKIRNAFPNALDLVQISVEAGLGFDAAINRVGHELGRVAPEVAYEFLLLQIEIQAGRDREAALFDMADRMGIDEAKSFALVIVQSLQFGTSLTQALKTYAVEMREMRELNAQERANALPVKMSGVMSMMMLPALFLITLTPIIIRYTAIY